MELSTSLRRQAGQLHQRPNLDRALARTWNLAGNVDRLIQILGLNHEITAKLFTRFRERPVGHQSLVVAYLDAGRCRHRLQRVGVQILPLRLKPMGKLGRLPVALLPLRLGPGVFVGVNQKHVFHCVPPSVNRTVNAEIDTLSPYFFPANWVRSRSCRSYTSGPYAMANSSSSNIWRISTSAPPSNGARLSHSTASSIDFVCHSQ